MNIAEHLRIWLLATAFLTAAVIGLTLNGSARAQQADTPSGLEVPRFVSL